MMATFDYMVLTGFIKLTLLFFYYRIFSPQTTVKYFIIGGIVFVACINTALFFATVFECSPVALLWDSSLSGHCINSEVLPYISGAVSSATDIFVLILPIRLLWSLNLNYARKVRLIAVFGLGIL